MSTDTTPSSLTPSSLNVEQQREAARKRLAAKRDLGRHVVVYVVVNGFVTLAWFFTGAGYFWPAWLMAPWGAGLLLQAWDVFGRRPITEEDIEAEMRRWQGR